MISLKNIYSKINGEEILKNVNFTVSRGEFVCLVGESGSGKTTVLKVVARLIKPSKGELNADNKPALVFQNFALMPWLTVEQNIIFPLTIAGVVPNLANLEKVLVEMGLGQLRDRLPRELSGGQKQRVGIARALIIKPKILLLDEPFSALDIKTANELRNDLLRLWKENDLTVLMVSHQVEEAVYLADRILVFKNGAVKNHFVVPFPRPRNIESRELLRFADKVKTTLARL